MDRILSLCLLSVLLVGGANSACNTSPCLSLNNDLFAATAASDVQEWCRISIPYVKCLEDLPQECQTADHKASIQQYKDLQKGNGCSSASALVMSFVSLIVCYTTARLIP